MIYLASLFSNGATTDSGEHKMVREQRYLYTLKHLARLMNNGEFVFSPIAHCYETSNVYSLPKEYDFWQENDRHFINKCDKVVVLCMVDQYGCWEQSKGIQDEIWFAMSLGIPVEYIKCDDYILDVKDRVIVKKIMDNFFDVCDDHNIDFTMFNFGLHEDSVEIYTAQEHEEHMFNGDMGGEIFSGEEMEAFLLSVARQNQYYKKKMEG